MMNVMNKNDSHFQVDSSCDQINPSIFADQPLSSVFDMNSNDVCDNMNSGANSNIGSFDANQNKRLLKQIRNKNKKDFKDLVSNFWGPSQNNNNESQQSQDLLPRRFSSVDSFGEFHPIDLTEKNFPNGKPNATMDKRVPLKIPSSNAFFSNNTLMSRNLFRPMNVGSLSSNMMPPITQSMPSMGNDTNQSPKAYKQSAVEIINAATNIVNEIDNMNCTTTGPLDRNIVSEPSEYDIICGRNSGAYNFIGNRRFRVTIEMNLQRYIDSPTREDKTKVIKSIVWMLKDQVGARFLKKESGTRVSANGTRRRKAPHYVIMTDKQAREKVGHALRDLVIAARKEQEESKKKQQQ